MNLDVGLAARVIAGIRTHTATRTGCPEWDTAGIVAALTATNGSPGSVLAAAALAAEDAKLKAPSTAGFRNHWPANAQSAAPVSHNVACVEHPDHDMPCPHLDHHGQMTLDEIAEAAAAVRAAIPARTREPRPTTLTEPADRLEQVRALIPQEDHDA